MKIKAFVCYFLLLGCLSSAAACGGDDEGAPVPPPPAPPEDAGSGNMRVKTRGENLYIAAMICRSGIFVTRMAKATFS